MLHVLGQDLELGFPLRITGSRPLQLVDEQARHVVLLLGLVHQLVLDVILLAHRRIEDLLLDAGVNLESHDVAFSAIFCFCFESSVSSNCRNSSFTSR